MKLVYSAVLLLGFAAQSFASAHVLSRSAKAVATESPARAVKHAGQGSYFLLKKSVYPFRHPAKTSHGLYTAGKQVF